MTSVCAIQDLPDLWRHRWLSLSLDGSRKMAAFLINRRSLSLSRSLALFPSTFPPLTPCPLRELLIFTLSLEPIQRLRDMLVGTKIRESMS